MLAAWRPFSVGMVPSLPPILTPYHACHPSFFFFLPHTQPQASFSLSCTLSKRNANGFMLLRLLEGVVSAQPSVRYSAFGYLHCSQMKTQSTFWAAGYKKTFSTSSHSWVGSGIARHLQKPRSLPGRTLHASKRCLIWGPGERAPGANVPFKESLLL